MSRLLVLTVLLFYVQNSFAFNLLNEQITVHKGDTFSGPAPSANPKSYLVPPDNFEHQYKLFGVETPYTEQPYGKQAIKLLRTILNSRNNVELSTVRYLNNRKTLVKASVNGSDISGLLVGHGLAWVRGCGTTSYCLRLKKLEQEVKQKEIGLWASAKPVKPWIWQARKRFSTTGSETDIASARIGDARKKKAIANSGEAFTPYPRRANQSYIVTTESGNTIHCNAITFSDDLATLYTGRYLISISQKQIIAIKKSKEKYVPF